MKVLNLILGLAIAIGLSAAVSFDVLAQGTSGAASLNITPGARADAMGRANVALTNDATANWWNPAALANVNEHIFSLMHTQLVPDLADDVYYEYLGYAQHVEGWGGVGASLIFLTYGKSIATNEQGQELGTFSSYELSPAISLGTQIAKGLSAGVSLKYVYVMLAPRNIIEAVAGEGSAGTGDTFAADLGLLYEVPKSPIRIGLNVQNLGPNISFIDEDQSDPIGRNLKLGIGAKVFDTGSFRLLAEGDVNKSLVYSDEDPVYNVGSEIGFGTFGALRIGYIHDAVGEITAPTFGLGAAVGGLQVDYASVPQAEDLDRVQKFSISYRF